MLHVNDDSNDELFRRAAEDYILGAENPDWDTFANKINTEFLPPAPEAVKPEIKMGQRSLFSFLTFGYRKRTWKKMIAFFSMWPDELHRKSKKKDNPGLVRTYPGAVVFCRFNANTGSGLLS